MGYGNIRTRPFVKIGPLYSESSVQAEYIRGRSDMQDEIIAKLFSFDAGKCAQIAGSIAANKA
jgi:hypothetical protein